MPRFDWLRTCRCTPRSTCFGLKSCSLAAARSGAPREPWAVAHLHESILTGGHLNGPDSTLPPSVVRPAYPPWGTRRRPSRGGDATCAPPSDRRACGSRSARWRSPPTSSRGHHTRRLPRRLAPARRHGDRRRRLDASSPSLRPSDPRWSDGVQGNELHPRPISPLGSPRSHGAGAPSLRGLGRCLPPARPPYSGSPRGDRRTGV